jgi:hypothetical protein
LHIGFEFNPHPTQSDLDNRTKFGFIAILNIIADILFVTIWYLRKKESAIITKALTASLLGSSSNNLIMDKIAAYSWGGYRSSLLYVCAIIAFVPIDLLDFAFGFEIYFLRTIKLLRLALLAVSSTNFWKYVAKKQIHVNTNYLRLLRDIFAVGYTAHVFGCMFMLLAHIECGFPLDHKKCLTSWALNANLEGKDIGHQYVRAFYWGLISTLPLGNGEAIVPKTDAEVVFTCILFLWGVMLQMQLIANFCFVFEISDKLRNEFDRKVDDLNMFMKNRKIPLEIKNRVLAYLEYSWKHLRGLDEAHVINALPPHLRRDALQFLQSTTVGQAPFW